MKYKVGDILVCKRDLWYGYYGVFFRKGDRIRVIFIDISVNCILVEFCDKYNNDDIFSYCFNLNSGGTYHFDIGDWFNGIRYIRKEKLSSLAR